MFKRNKSCEQCMNCMYVEHGDMYCDLTIGENEVKFVYDEFCPTEHYMWCNGKKFERR